jgi:hypothetical protein
LSSIRSRCGRRQKGEKRPADVINAAIIGKQRRHPDNSWEERVSPMTHESGVRSGKWTADVRDGSMNETARAVERCGWRHPHGAIRDRGATG